MRDRFQEEVSTQYLIGNYEFNDYRFLKSLKERITVSVNSLDEDYKTSILITGQYELVLALETELLNILDNIVPPVFNSVNGAVNSLGTQIDRGLIEQLKYSCINRPNASAIERLKACHQSLTSQKRVKQMGYSNFPKGDESEFAIGDREWEVVIRFQRRNEYWWCIEGIY